MNLRDMIVRGRLIGLACSECHATAELDPAPFARRRGGHTTLDQIRPDLACPECDSYDIRLRPVRLRLIHQRPVRLRDGRRHPRTGASAAAQAELPPWLAPPLAAPMPADDYWRLAAHATRLPH